MSPESAPHFDAGARPQYTAGYKGATFSPTVPLKGQEPGLVNLSPAASIFISTLLPLFWIRPLRLKDVPAAQAAEVAAEEDGAKQPYTAKESCNRYFNRNEQPATQNPSKELGREVRAAPQIAPSQDPGEQLWQTACCYNSRQMEMCLLVKAVIPQEERNYVVLNTLWVTDRERSRNRKQLIRLGFGI